MVGAVGAPTDQYFYAPGIRDRVTPEVRLSCDVPVGSYGPGSGGSDLALWISRSRSRGPLPAVRISPGRSHVADLMRQISR